MGNWAGPCYRQLVRKMLRSMVPLVLLLCGCGAPKPAAQAPDDELKRLLGSGAKVVDVRTPEEFARGHVKGAVNVPLRDIDLRIESIAADKDAPLLVHCQSGGRSARAKDILDRKGYTRVYDLGSLAHARQVMEGKE